MGAAPAKSLVIGDGRNASPYGCQRTDRNLGQAYRYFEFVIHCANAEADSTKKPGKYLRTACTN
jgi:hypothetical protein